MSATCCNLQWTDDEYAEHLKTGLHAEIASLRAQLAAEREQRAWETDRANANAREVERLREALDDDAQSANMALAERDEARASLAEAVRERDDARRARDEYQMDAARFKGGYLTASTEVARLRAQAWELRSALRRIANPAPHDGAPVDGCDCDDCEVRRLLRAPGERP